MLSRILSMVTTIKLYAAMPMKKMIQEMIQEKTAETLCNFLKKTKRLRLRVYRCPECDRWHLTHTEKLFNPYS